jgi:hypothetical protein
MAIRYSLKELLGRDTSIDPNAFVVNHPFIAYNPLAMERQVTYQVSCCQGRLAMVIVAYELSNERFRAFHGQGMRREGENNYHMKPSKRYRTFIDLEKLNRLNAEGCLACGHKFSLGDEVVLARGKWQGFKYIHENEAILDRKTDTYYERRHYADVVKDRHG